MKRTISLILALCLMATLFVGCSGGSSSSGGSSAGSSGPQTKTYVMDCGMSITAETGLSKMSLDGYDAYYTSNDIGFVLLKEDKYEGMTLAEYADLLAEVNGYDAMTMNAYGLYTTNHTFTNAGSTFWYYTTAHETEDSFIMLQFFCFEKDRAEYESYFAEWSASLTEN